MQNTEPSIMWDLYYINIFILNNNQATSYHESTKNKTVNSLEYENQYILLLVTYYSCQ